MVTPARQPEKRLPPRQSAILRFIAKHLKEKQYAPNIREIGNATAITSTSVVNYHLEKLEQRGYLERDPHVSRGLRLIRMPGGAQPGTVFTASLTELSIEVPLTGDPKHVIATLHNIQAKLQAFTQGFTQKHTP